MPQEESLKEEARRIFGKREMLWNIQRQILGARLKGKPITEELIYKILECLESYQKVEEQNWEMEKYIDNEIEKDILQESKILNTKIKEVD